MRKHLRKHFIKLMTIIVCAGLLCPASPLAAKAEATMTLVEPSETSIKKCITEGSFDFIVESDEPIEYSSQNEQVAVVDENGHVTLVGAGFTKLYAYAKDVDDTTTHIELKLTVTKDPDPFSAKAIYVPRGCTSFNLNVQKKYPDLNLTYYTREGETAFTVDQTGQVTLLTDKPGTYVANVSSEETAIAEAKRIGVAFCIEKWDQTLTGKTKVTGVFGKKVKLNVKAKTALTYRSEDKTTATVDKSGYVTFKHPGKAKIVAVAEIDEYYKMNSLSITVTSKLGKPTLKATAGKRMVKLNWNKVPKAQKYLIYCKYPGKKSCKLVATKLASVKGISHKNLKKGKKYSYKVRAYLKLNGKKYYGPYSKAVTVKVK